MHVRMAKGSEEIEWRVVGNTGYRFDSDAVYEIGFVSYHKAVSWIMRTTARRLNEGFIFIE